jgi:hypothetical protein
MILSMCPLIVYLLCFAIFGQAAYHRLEARENGGVPCILKDYMFPNCKSDVLDRYTAKTKT